MILHWREEPGAWWDLRQHCCSGNTATKLSSHSILPFLCRVDRRGQCHSHVTDEKTQVHQATRLLPVVLSHSSISVLQSTGLCFLFFAGVTLTPVSEPLCLLFCETRTLSPSFPLAWLPEAHCRSYFRSPSLGVIFPDHLDVPVYPHIDPFLARFIALNDIVGLLFHSHPTVPSDDKPLKAWNMVVGLTSSPQESSTVSGML